MSTEHAPAAPDAIDLHSSLRGVVGRETARAAVYFALRDAGEEPLVAALATFSSPTIGSLKLRGATSVRGRQIRRALLRALYRGEVLPPALAFRCRGEIALVEALPRAGEYVHVTPALRDYVAALVGPSGE